MRDRDNPWADAANQAVGALYKHYMSQPSAGEIQQQELKNQLIQSNLQTDELQRQNLQSQMGERNFKLGQLRRENEFADKFASAFSELPQVQGVVPDDGSIGPQVPVTQSDRSGAIANLFESFAPRLNPDQVEASRDALGAANALRFDDPIQRQLAIDEKATSYQNMMPGYNLSPGQIRFDGNNEQIASAPFKEGGGSYIETADGTVISLDGGQPKLAPSKSTVNTLQGQQVENAKLRQLLDYNRELASQDALNFGVPGMVKGVLQDTGALLGGVSQSFGYEQTDQAINDVQLKAQQYNINPALLPGIYDPSLDALQTASDLLVFQAAAALAEQQGRGMSDRDVTYFRNVVGNPRSLFSHQDKYLAKLGVIENIVGGRELVTDTTLGGNVTGGASGQTPIVTPNDIDNMSEQELDAFLAGG